MGRLRSILIVLLVLTTGSALTLACAFVCESGRAPAASRAALAAGASHCHGAPAKIPDGEGFRPAHALCPVMDSLHGSEARALSPVAKAPVSGVAMLPFESSLLAVAYAGTARGAGSRDPAPPRPSPPFLRNLVLRL
jgi:hypothetical protein